MEAAVGKAWDTGHRRAVCRPSAQSLGARGGQLRMGRHPNLGLQMGCPGRQDLLLAVGKELLQIDGLGQREKAM